MVATSSERNSLATKYGADGKYAALFTTAPSGSSPGTEVTGGSYARQAITWGAPSGSPAVSTATVTFSGLPACTVNGGGVYSAATGGTYLDGATVSPGVSVAAGQSFTLTLTVTVT